MDILKDTRRWMFQVAENKFDAMTVEYTIFYKQGSIVDIRNQHHHSVEKGSECWEYFTKKYAGMI